MTFFYSRPSTSLRLVALLLVGRGTALRVPAPAMLLGADGLPMKKTSAPPPASGGGLLGVEDGKPASSGNADADALQAAYARPATSTRGASNIEMPDDLANFDPTFDPLAVERPKHDLAAASGRPEEAVWGACAAADASELGAWSAHMVSSGVVRMLGLFSAEEAAARSNAGTAEGYFSELIAAGPFDPSHVGLLDPRAEGAREAVLRCLRDAQGAKQKLCVHCADGNTLTSVVLADWL